MMAQAMYAIRIHWHGQPPLPHMAMMPPTPPGLSTLPMLECLDLKCNYVERLAEARAAPTIISP